MATDQGLFGPTVEQVRALQEAEFLQETAGRSSSFVGGAVFGRAVGRALGGEDPRIQRARAAGEVRQLAMASGLAPDDPEFARTVAREFAHRGLFRESLAALERGREIQTQQAELERAQAQARGAQFDVLRSQEQAESARIENLTLADRNDADLNRIIQQTATSRASEAKLRAEASRAGTAFARAQVKEGLDSGIKVANFAAKQPVVANATEALRGYNLVHGAVTQLLQGAVSPQIADLQMVVGLFKINDPNSAVLSSEVRSVEDLRAPNDQLQFWVDRLRAGGGQLTNSERKQIAILAKQTMTGRIAAARKFQKTLNSRIGNLPDRGVANIPFTNLDEIPDLPAEFNFPEPPPERLQEQAQSTQRAVQDLAGQVPPIVRGAIEGILPQQAQGLSAIADRLATPTPPQPSILDRIHPNTLAQIKRMPARAQGRALRRRLRALKGSLAVDPRVLAGLSNDALRNELDRR